MEALMGIIVLGTSIWVLIDAKSIGIKKGQIKGIANMGPWGWFFVCLLLWIVGFPVYLAKRGEFIKINLAATQQTKNKQPPGGDPIAQLEKLGQLKEKGMITEEEFNIKKKELLE